MKTNDIKKGMRVQLRNGWFGTMADNAKGNTRMVDVEGFCREIGSVYSHDIVLVWPEVSSIGQGVGMGIVVEHTPAQLKLQAMVKAMGM